MLEDLQKVFEMGAFNLKVSVKQWMEGGDSQRTAVQVTHKEGYIRSQFSPHSEGQQHKQ